MHANALGRLMGTWPVIIPPSPGVLCAYGDATTSLRDQSVRTLVRSFNDLTDASLREILQELAEVASAPLIEQGIAQSEHEIVYSADLRYLGQGFEIPVDIDLAAFDGNGGGLDALRAVFDAEHQRLFSFLLNAEHEMVTVRATASGPRPEVAAQTLSAASADPSKALRFSTEIWVDDAFVQANVYDRGLLAAGNVVRGPAIVTEMDSTTLVLPGHEATVHASGSLLIRPSSAEKTQEA